MQPIVNILILAFGVWPRVLLVILVLSCPKMPLKKVQRKWTGRWFTRKMVKRKKRWLEVTIGGGVQSVAAGHTHTHHTATRVKRGDLPKHSEQTLVGPPPGGSIGTATTSDNSSLAHTETSSLTNPSMNFTQYDLSSIQDSCRSTFQNNFKPFKWLLGRCISNYNTWHRKQKQFKLFGAFLLHLL